MAGSRQAEGETLGWGVGCFPQYFLICILKIRWEERHCCFQGNKVSSCGSSCHLIIWICSRWHAGCTRELTVQFLLWGGGSLNEWLCPQAPCKHRSSRHKKWMKFFLMNLLHCIQCVERKEDDGKWRGWHAVKVTSLMWKLASVISLNENSSGDYKNKEQQCFVILKSSKTFCPAWGPFLKLLFC